MKICFSPEQFFDDEGNVLSAGRISIFYHGTDNLVPLYHFQADSYVAAENPIIAGESGRIDGVFFDAAIVTVKVEKHLEDGTYEQVDTYEYGIDVPGGKSDEVVTGVSGLKEASPELGSVTVVGYHNSYDCGPRTYVWDPNSNDQADDGCVVASNVELTGRWLLVWPDEILPAAIYGVTPGNTSNMAALMARPRMYGGSYSIMAPGTTGFPAGDFSTSVTPSFSTTYDLCLDRGTRFGDLTITAPRFSVSGLSTEAQGNYQIRLPDGIASELKLSLVKSRTQVGATNANTIVIDRDNTVGDSTITLSGKLVLAYIDIPSWLTFEDSIVLRPSTGFMKGKTVQASDVLKVGNLFRIVPHEDVMNPYYEFYSQGNDSYPTMRLRDDQCVLFHNGVTVQEGFDIPARTINGTSYPQQWWGYFDDGEDGPVVQIKAKGDVEVTNLKGNLTSTTSSIGTLNVTSEAKVSKLMGRNYDFIPLFSGFVRSYSEVDLNWTSYGSHILPTEVPADALIKIHMTWAWNDSSSVPISDYIHLSGASGRSFGDVIALENCGPQSASFTFSNMYRDGNAQTIAEKSGPIYVIDMNLNLIDIIPAFERHTFMYNGSGWERVSV